MEKLRSWEQVPVIGSRRASDIPVEDRSVTKMRIIQELRQQSLQLKDDDGLTAYQRSCWLRTRKRRVAPPGLKCGQTQLLDLKPFLPVSDCERAALPASIETLSQHLAV